MVEKILIILILCLGKLGCNAMLSEADKQLKVLEKLEKNIPEELENNRKAIIGYCLELGTVAPDVIDSSCTMVKTSEPDKKLGFFFCSI